MKHLLDHSVVLNTCSRLVQGLKRAVKSSLLFGRKAKKTQPFSSRLVAAMNRVHPALWLERQMKESRLFAWLYHYWGALCAQPMKGLLAFFAPLLLLIALWMAMGHRFWMAGGFLAALGGCFLVFWREQSLGEWLSGSWLLHRCPLPKGQARRSVVLYLAFCGAAGGAVALFLGAGLGLAGAVLLAALPAVFCVPPLWMVCLLCGLLPLMETTVCWVLSVLIAILYFIGRAFGNQEGKPLDQTDLLLLLFPLLCVFSTIFSYDTADSAKVAGMWIGLFACCFFLRRIVCSRKRLYIVLAAFAIGAAASGLFGLWQFLSGQVDTTWTDTNLFEELELRVYSTFENPNVYGEFLLLVMPPIAGLALSIKGRKRWLLWGIEGLLLVNLALTYSRGCYVGLALTALVFLWKLHKRWTVAALAMGVPLALVLMPASVMERIGSIGNMEDGSTAYRIYIYIGVVALLAQYWFCGVGLGEGAFNKIYPEYALPAIDAPHSHSLFLQMVLSFGILGLVYLVAVLSKYQRGLKAAYEKAMPKDRRLLACFSALLWGVLLQSAFDYTWYNYRVFQLFWIIIALGFAAAEICSLEEGKQHETKI